MLERTNHDTRQTAMLENIRWSRVLLEGVVIVGSILLAFGIQAWWDQRQERHAETEYITAIRDEIERNLEALDGNIWVAQITHDALQRVETLIETGAYRDSATVFISNALRGAQSGGAPRVATAVFDELTSTGRIVIIEDLDLRRQVLELYARIQVNFERMARNSDEIDARMYSVVARHIPSGIVERGPAPMDYPLDTSALSSEDLRDIAESIAADPALPSEMRAEFLKREDQKFYRANYQAAPARGPYAIGGSCTVRPSSAAPERCWGYALTSRLLQSREREARALRRREHVGRAAESQIRYVSK